MIVPIYFRAYDAMRLRDFPGWPAGVDADSTVFIDERLDVRSAPAPDAEIIYTGESVAWQEFCRNELAFAVPDWDAESRQVREALQ